MKHSLLCIAYLALAGCAGSKVISSLETGDRSEDFKYKNGSTGVRYSVTHDEEYLYVKLLATDRISMAKIARGGLQVFFDIEGKKNRDVYLQYPLTQEQQQALRGQGRPGGLGGRAGGRQGANQNEQGQRRNISQMLQFVPPQAQFVRFEAMDDLNMQDPEVDILASLYSPSGEDIVYDLAIPFSRLSAQGMAGLESLSIGIRSGKLELRAQGANRPGGGQGRGRPGGGGGGGRPGGPGGGGQGGAQGNAEAMSTPFEFWFQVEFPESAG